MSTKKTKQTVSSKRKCGSRVFILGENLLSLTGYNNDRLYSGAYFMVRSQVRQAVLEARMFTVSCFYNGTRGETSFPINFYEGTNIISKIGCQQFSQIEGRKLSRWATYDEIKIGKIVVAQFVVPTQFLVPKLA